MAESTLTDSSSVALVPPQRLGSLLGSARAGRGLTLEDLAAASGGAFSTARLSSIENGCVALDDEALAGIADLYGMSTTQLVPSRSKLVVDIAEGVLDVDGRRGELPHLATRDQVLSSYLGLVYSMREVRYGTKITLRDEDLDVLGRVLDAGPSAVEADLVALMRQIDAAPSWRERLLRPRVLVPAAGILVAFCAAGALLLVTGDDPAPVTRTTTQAPAAVVVPTEIGDAVVQERGPDGGPGPVEVRGGGAPEVGVEIGEPKVIERPASDVPPPSIGEPLVIERDGPDTGSNAPTF